MKTGAGRWPVDGFVSAISFDHLIPASFAVDMDSDIWGQHLELRFEEYLNPAWLVCAPSGTGKSSLVAFLTGLRTDFRGSIAYTVQTATSEQKMAIDGLAPKDWATARRNNLATVYQDFRLIPWLSARDNLHLSPNSQHHRNLGNSPDQLAEEWFDRLEIRGSLDQPVHRLSRGEQQRLAIIRAITRPFNILILDEAFSHLDRRLREMSARAIGEHCQKNRQAILAFDLDANADFPWVEVFQLDRNRP